MLVNDPVLISMIEELTDKYNKMQDFLIDDEPCIDIVRSVYELECTVREGANKQVISSQADSLIKISRIWADFFPANTSNQPI